MPRAGLLGLWGHLCTSGDQATYVPIRLSPKWWLWNQLVGSSPSSWKGLWRGNASHRQPCDGVFNKRDPWNGIHSVLYSRLMRFYIGQFMLHGRCTVYNENYWVIHIILVYHKCSNWTMQGHCFNGHYTDWSSRFRFIKIPLVIHSLQRPTHPQACCNYQRSSWVTETSWALKKHKKNCYSRLWLPTA